MVPTSIAALQAETAKSAQAGAGTGLGRAAEADDSTWGLNALGWSLTV
jgi:hypothetical protein